VGSSVHRELANARGVIASDETLYSTLAARSGGRKLSKSNLDVPACLKRARLSVDGLAQDLEVLGPDEGASRQMAEVLRRDVAPYLDSYAEAVEQLVEANEALLPHASRRTLRNVTFQQPTFHTGERWAAQLDTVGHCIKLASELAGKGRVEGEGDWLGPLTPVDELVGESKAVAVLEALRWLHGVFRGNQLFSYEYNRHRCGISLTERGWLPYRGVIYELGVAAAELAKWSEELLSNGALGALEGTVRHLRDEDSVTLRQLSDQALTVVLKNFGYFNRLSDDDYRRTPAWCEKEINNPQPPADPAWAEKLEAITHRLEAATQGLYAAEVAGAPPLRADDETGQAGQAVADSLATSTSIRSVRPTELEVGSDTRQLAKGLAQSRGQVALSKVLYFKRLLQIEGPRGPNGCDVIANLSQCASSLEELAQRVRSAPKQDEASEALARQLGELDAPYVLAFAQGLHELSARTLAQLGPLEKLDPQVLVAPPLCTGEVWASQLDPILEHVFEADQLLRGERQAEATREEPRLTPQQLLALSESEAIRETLTEARRVIHRDGVFEERWTRRLGRTQKHAQGEDVLSKLLSAASALESFGRELEGAAREGNARDTLCALLLESDVRYLLHYQAALVELEDRNLAPLRKDGRDQTTGLPAQVRRTGEDWATQLDTLLNHLSAAELLLKGASDDEVFTALQAPSTSAAHL
jgi:hypothetical protein